MAKTSDKPDWRLIGENGNIFNLIGIAASTLWEYVLAEHAVEMRKRTIGGKCHDYHGRNTIYEAPPLQAEEMAESIGKEGMRFG